MASFLGVIFCYYLVFHLWFLLFTTLVVVLKRYYNGCFSYLLNYKNHRNDWACWKTRRSLCWFLASIFLWPSALRPVIVLRFWGTLGQPLFSIFSNNVTLWVYQSLLLLPRQKYLKATDLREKGLILLLFRSGGRNGSCLWKKRRKEMRFKGKRRSGARLSFSNPVPLAPYFWGVSVPHPWDSTASPKSNHSWRPSAQICET